MEKPKGQTHKTYGKHLSYSVLGTGISENRQCGLKPGFKASLKSLL